MEQPKKEPENQPENESRTPPRIEILSDLNNYQERIESHWESAKADYQSKVNKILDEFIEHNVHTPDPSSKEPSPHFAESEAETEERVEKLLSRANKAVRMAEKKNYFSGSSLRDTSPFQLSLESDWNSRSWIKKIKHFSSWISALVCAGIIGWLLWMPVKSHDLPYTHATGLLVDQNKIYVVDWFRKTLFVHDQKYGFPITAVENMPNQFVTGFARTPTRVWSIDGLNHEFLEHATTPEHIVNEKHPTPGAKPVGLYFDGTDLWSMDDENKMLYRHHGNDIEEIKATYRLPNISLSGVVVRKNKVWILSEKSRVLKTFRLEDPVKELKSYDLDSYLEGASVTSFSLDNDSVWLTTENPTKLLQIPFRKLNR